MNLIAITQSDNDGFMQVSERLRSKAEIIGPPALEEITQEVETVRAERYAGRKAEDCIFKFSYRHRSFKI